MPHLRIGRGVLGAALLMCSACPPHSPPAPPQKPPAPLQKPPEPVAQTTPPVAAKPPLVDAPLVLVEVPQKGLPLTGFRIDPTGSFAGAIAKRDPGKCDLWRLVEHGYAGQVPAARCQGWPEYKFTQLERPSDSPAAAKPADDVKTSADGKLRARSRKTLIEISDVATGKITNKLVLRDNDEIIPGTLRFGAHGLVVVAKVQVENSITRHRGYLFSGPPFGAPRITKMGGINLNDESVLIEPRGRLCFVTQHQERVGEGLVVFDLVSTRTTPLSWDPPSPVGGELGGGTSSFAPGKWQGGTRPYFETIETLSYLDQEDKQTVTWRILAAPGDRRVLRLAPSEEGNTNPEFLPPKTMKGTALSEQEASALVRNFMGIRMDTLRRVSDGEELTLTEKGCANSKRGAYSCGLRTLKQRVYLLGPDPFTSPMVHGDQLASLMNDTKLIEHFFSGAPMPPRTVERLGAAPTLEVRSVKYEATPHRIVIDLVAHDGGDGVSVARVVRLHPQPDLASQGVRPPTEVRTPLSVDKPTTVTVPLADDTCGVLRIYACNGPGHVCSQQVTVPICQHDEDYVEGQEFEVGLEDD